MWLLDFLLLFFPTPAQKRGLLYPFAATCMVVWFCWPIATSNCDTPFHYSPTSSLKDRGAALSISDQVTKQCVILSWIMFSYCPKKPNQDKCLYLQMAYHFHKWLLSWAARDTWWLSLWILLRIEFRDFWCHKYETLQLELKMTVVRLVSFVSWMQKEGIPVWPVGYRCKIRSQF